MSNSFIAMFDTIYMAVLLAAMVKNIPRDVDVFVKHVNKDGVSLFSY